jgi:hypothetical protein
MIQINYQKRKNTDFLNSLEDKNSLFLSKAQNYIPIYNKFFALSDTNYNTISLNHHWHISSVKKFKHEEEIVNLYDCKIKNTNNKTKEKPIFFKIAPLLDPYKYLIGKYNLADKRLLTLPNLNSTALECHEKYLDQNNSAYVDGFFLFLTSKLLHEHKFLHGVDYYDTFLGIKENYLINVYDDLDYLTNSDYFNKNKNVLFKIDEYGHLFNESKLKPIKIDNTSIKSQVTINSMDNDMFENIFEEKDNICFNNELLEENLIIINSKDTNTTLNSSSSCSSRTSHTNSYDNDNNEDEDEDTIIDDEEEEDENNDENKEEMEEEKEDAEDDSEDEKIMVTIPKFPVQVIGMEFCESTFDDLILTEDLTNDEWFSAFMQIIMMLIAYQKAFGFTHNDLHTNNVMYNLTDKKFIYYCYKNKYYKVPTFGRIYKIIDFGRSIYKFNGQLFCSDSFQIGGDASTQYNTEPYLNHKKPRLEPNYSFDLCRLACSLFDYIIEDFDEMKDINKCKEPLKRLILEWCSDDNGLNMLYKNNGTDRYPDFKLYKMISRCVHKHTPQAQLERPEFDIYSKFNNNNDLPSDVVDIDKIPIYF